MSVRGGHINTKFRIYLASDVLTEPNLRLTVIYGLHGTYGSVVEMHPTGLKK